MKLKTDKDVMMTQHKDRPGRPTIYSDDLANEICNAIACSSKGIRRLYNECAHFPTPDTIYRWVKEHREFSDQYARAKRQQIEVIIDEIMGIADDTSNDYSTNEDGKLICNHEHIQRSRLRIDTRKWLAAKLAPRLYGDKVQIEETREAISQETLEANERVRKAYEREY